MRLTWLKNDFICEELYAPFKINKDIDYRTDLEKRKTSSQEAKTASLCPSHRTPGDAPDWFHQVSRHTPPFPSVVPIHHSTG